MGINIGFMLIFASLMACNYKAESNNNKTSFNKQDSIKMEIATFGGGCFWCTEAVFQRLNGVEKVVSGYAGGHVNNPTYKEICTGTTGHAEVIQITYNPEVISYLELLQVFFETHDPTTLNRQGNDVGTQYRSVIYFHSSEQEEIARKVKNDLNSENVFEKPVVTEISAIYNYYPAEDYHQEYYNNNSNQGYCTFVIAPKIEKLKKVFGDKLKENY